MRIYQPDKIAIEILKCIGKEMYQAQIATELNLKKQALYSRINSLVTYGYVLRGERDASLELKLTEKGVKAIALASRPVSQTFTSSPSQRPHSFQVNGFVYRTSWDRLPATLESLGIPYEWQIKGNMLRFGYGDRELRATKQYLYCFIELAEMPQNVPIEEVKAKAIEKAGPYFEAFLAKTGLRCLRDRLGRLRLEVHKWENAYPGDYIATESLKDKTRIIYAYDKATGKSTWADSSLGPILKELETNDETTDAEYKKMFGAILTKEISPYDDEIHTRREIVDIKNVVYDLATETKYLAKNNITHIPYFEQALKKDAILIELAESLLPIAKARQLKHKLEDIRQRRL